MTRSEFVQKAAIAIHSQSVSPDVRRTWQEAEALAAAFPGVWETPTQNAAPKASGGGAGVFPNFGKSKGAPIAGASQNDLRYYAGAAIRSIEDASKARFLDSNKAQLASYIAEMERQGLDASEFKQVPAQDRGIEHERRPLPGDPAPSDDDIPF